MRPITNNYTEIDTYFDNPKYSIPDLTKMFGISTQSIYGHWKTKYGRDKLKERNRIVKHYKNTGENHPNYGKRGANAPKYRGILVDKRGYLIIIKPTWYTGRKSCKHVYVHHVVICEHLGISQIPHGWCVHHCDKDITNNSFENLVLLTQRDHTKLHQYLRKEGATTISKESTLKWVEAHGKVFNKEDFNDIVCSIR